MQPVDDTDYTGALGGKPMSRDEVLMDQITLLPMASNEPTRVSMSKSAGADSEWSLATRAWVQ